MWKTLGHLIDTLWYLATLLLKVELVGLPNVLALALHQDNYLGWMDQGDHFWYRTILLLKVRLGLIDKLLPEHVGLPHVLG